MFTNIDYLMNGNEKQRQAYRAIKSLRIMEDLSDYSPILCGTIPINIHVETSDLDVIMEACDLEQFEQQLVRLYRHHQDFVLKRRTIRNKPVIKANFKYEGFEFELFAQAQPSDRQNAYLHMIIENHILEKTPSLRMEIINMKKQGLKTEPAFCKVLGLEGDPFESLIEYGKEQGIIE
ncbi:DUF4269 domain-containing protein [Bacillus sp. JJ722]|uniref:DUF4269 domain-containing protein n=1 Tax=Bacillus sp. JJ722 TaxID=3122973 RepID=UPI002FFF1EB3